MCTLLLIQNIHSWTLLSSQILCRKAAGTKLHQRLVHDKVTSQLCFDQIETTRENDRRQFLLSTMNKSTMLIGAMLVNPLIANAAVQQASSSERTKPNFTQAEIFFFLHSIPTFAIVDPKGVPFMVVGEDAKLSAYFFTSYDEANRILSVARKSADKTIKDLIKEQNEKRKTAGLKAMTKNEIETEVGVNPWLDGRISTLPLDFSVGLASRGKIAGSYFRIAPSEDDIQDALNVESSIKELSEGKVPLFYIDDFEITKDGLEGRIPLYFQKAQLLEEYNKSSSSSSSSSSSEPVVKVTELFSILTQMTGTGQIDNDVGKLILVPPKDSVEKAKLCDRKGGNESPYKIGERIVVL